MVTETFTSMDIGYVEFHYRHINTLDRIMKRNRRMGIGAGIHRHTATHLSRFMNPANQITFVVALMANYVKTVFLAKGNAVRLDIGKGLGPVDAKFALPKQIQVGSVKDIDWFGDSRRHCTGSCL